MEYPAIEACMNDLVRRFYTNARVSGYGGRGDFMSADNGIEEFITVDLVSVGDEEVIRGTLSDRRFLAMKDTRETTTTEEKCLDSLQQEANGR